MSYKTKKVECKECGKEVEYYDIAWIKSTILCPLCGRDITTKNTRPGWKMPKVERNWRGGT